MPKKPKPRARYKDYSTTINGEIYGVVNIPVGNGKYKQKRKKVATTTEARQWALGELDKIRHGSIEIKTSTTFSQLAEWYKREYLIAPVYENGIKVEGVKDYKRLKEKLDKIIVPHFGPRQLSSITEHDFRSYARKRRENGISTATINRDLSLIRSMFRKGRAANQLLNIPKMPINLAAEKERDRVLSFDEESRLLAACVDKETITGERKGKPHTQTIKCHRAHLAPIIILAVDTAMRAGEISKLDWRDVDLVNDLITVQFFNSKTQKTRRVGMTPRVRETLAAMKHRKGPVFGSQSWRKAFATACERAKITDLRFHDLRHTATTRMIRAGIPHTEVMKITGHTQMKTFLRYLNLVDTTVQNAASQLGSFINSQPVIESDAVN
jgi:integrase